MFFLSNSDHFRNCEAATDSETSTLSDTKKFKKIKINKIMDLDGKTNKLEHKTQLIEIDKLLINIPNEAQNKLQRESTRRGVWHQVIQLKTTNDLQ